MSGNLYMLDGQRLIGRTGVSSGGQIYFYFAGTSVLAPIYTDSSLTILASNPVIANSDGSIPNIYLDGSILYSRYIVYDDGSTNSADPLTVAGVVDSMGTSMSIAPSQRAVTDAINSAMTVAANATATEAARAKNAEAGLNDRLVTAQNEIDDLQTVSNLGGSIPYDTYADAVADFAAYNPATAYAVGVRATDQGALWLNILAGTGVAPPTLPTTSNANWQLAKNPVAGQAIVIPITDTGSHTDPTNGATVTNTGIHVWATGTSGTGFHYLYPTDAALAKPYADAAAASEAAAATSETNAAASAASVLTARLGMGDLTYQAAMSVTLGGSATALTRGARDGTQADETNVGAQGATGQTMAGTTILATTSLPAWFSRTFPGASIDYEGMIRFDAASFITDKTLTQPVAPVAATYRDGTASNSIGTMVSSAVDGSDPTLYRRKANFTVTNYLASVGLSAAIPSATTNTTAHAYSWLSLSMRCVSVPAFAAYTASDVNEALNQYLAQHDDVGPLFSELGWSLTAANGAVASGTTTLSVTGAATGTWTGASSTAVGSWTIPANARSAFAGATPYIGLLVNTASTSGSFTRDLVLRANLNTTLANLSNSRMIQVTPTQRLYLLRASSVFVGTETQIQYVLRFATTQTNGNVANGVTETATVVDCFLALDSSGSNMFDASAVARKVMYQRLLSTASNTAISYDLTYSGELITKGDANVSLSNGATLISDSVGGAGFVTNGVSGASSFIDRRYVVDPTTSALLNNIPIRITEIYTATANWLTERGFGQTNKMFVDRGGIATRNDGTQVSLTQAGTLITRIIDFTWDSSITRFGICMQISPAAGSANNHSIQLTSWAFALQSPIQGTATSNSDKALASRGFISEAPFDSNYYARRNDAWIAFTPGGGGGGGSSAPSVALGVDGQSIELGPVKDADRGSYPQAFQSNTYRGSFVPYGPGSGAVGRGGWWPYVVDALHDWGYETHILNGAIGSQSFMRHGCGYLPARANSTAYFQKRAAGARNAGYYGDLIVMSGNVFRCTTGNDIAAWNDGGPFGWLDGRQCNLDYIDNTTGLLSASSDPGGWSSATTGSTITDGGIVWTCVGNTSSGVYAGLTTNSIFTEAQKGFGFDPFGTMQRLHDAMQEVRADRKIIYIQNGQADAGIGSTLYSNALQSKGNFWLSRGYEIAIGLTCWTPTSTTAAYDGLKAGRAAAIAALQAGPYGTNVHAGADLYTSMGTTGQMGGASFTGSIASGLLTVSAGGVPGGGAGSIEVGHRIVHVVDASTSVILGTVSSFGTGTGGVGTYNLTGGVDAPSEAMKSSGIWFQTTPADLNIHITGAASVGSDLNSISCAGKYVSDALKAFIPEIP